MATEATVVRCATLPVSVPLGERPDGTPWTWAALDAALVPAFRLATDAANWCVHEMFKRDVPGVAKTPGTVKPRGKTNPGGFYSYGEFLAAHPGCTAKGGAWSGAAQSLNICLRYAERKYRDTRHAVMVRHDTGLLTVRFPYPFPVDADAWRPRYEGDFPVVALALPGVGSVDLRLKRTGDFRRQLALFRRFVDGTAKKGEAALYRNRKGQLLLKLVGHFPRAARVGADNVCFLHTDPGALLVAEVNGRSVTVTNGDHLRRAHAVIRSTADRHRAWLRRTSEDKKREVRMDRRQQTNLNQKVEERCAEQRARIDTAVKQIAAQVARFCERQRVGVLAYDDSVKSFLPDGFPWHALETRLRQLFEGEMGGEWLDGGGTGGPYPCGRSAEDVEGRAEWLARARALLQTVPKVAAHKSRPRGRSHPGVSRTPAT